MQNSRTNIRLGIERLIAEKSGLIEGGRIGLICNQSSVTHKFSHAADELFAFKKSELVALFGPQHGIRGEVQDNMIETPHATDRKTGLPVYSLYSETREPTEEMLKGIDALVFDMQDVGCRVYTFIYTMANCMIAAKKFGLKVVVCDRPNPINGMNVEGNILSEEFKSFVGQYRIPMRHGMTVGELARLFNEQFNIGCDLQVMKMEGWKREMWFDETNAPWVLPSPNMPTAETATVFPGTVYLEGTMLSEGRGTTRPFEIVGAPFISATEFAAYLNGLSMPGVFFRECGFQPTFQKHAGMICEGVQIHVMDRDVFKPVIAGVAVMKAAVDLYGERFEWKKPPYEYIYDKLPIDVIAGTDDLRLKIEKSESLQHISEAWEEDETNFKSLRNDFLLY